MAASQETRSWVGRTVYDGSGSKIGKLDEVYRSREDDSPTWGVVKYGPLRKTTLVPLSGAREDGEDLRVDAAEDRIKAAPDVDTGDNLSPPDEDRLRRHYAGGAA